MRILIGFVLIGMIGGFHGALAQDIPPPPTKDWKAIRYSPYPGQDFPNQVFYGDTHLHTGYSTDAGMVGCTLGPEEAYRFALGATVTSSTGVAARSLGPGATQEPVGQNDSRLGAVRAGRVPRGV
jgi:hypothetical protein